MNRPFLLSLVFFTCFATFGQTNPFTIDFLPKIIPPSPAAAALGKYADIPISNYSGTPSISIPLYEIKVDGFTLPISLSYHASGIKVNEEASWVGLGWVLNAGGVVMRTVMKRDDFFHRINDIPGRTVPSEGQVPDYNTFLSGIMFPEEHTAEYYDPFITEIDCSHVCLTINGHERCCDFKKTFGEAIYDAEPDIFSFNFNGRSGKFIYKENGAAVFFPHQDLKITSNGVLSTPFEILDENGVKYTFATKEEVRSIHYAKNGIGMDRKAITGFYLSKITLANGKQISFNYKEEYYKSIGVKQYTSLGSGEHLNNWSQPQTYTSGWCLSSIVWDEGQLDFETANRADYLPFDSNPWPYPAYNIEHPAQRLTGIIVKNKNLEIIKQFALNQSYFNESLTSTEFKRLKLNSIVEKKGTSTLAPHQFTYDNGELKSKLSFGDHWGFSNGAPENNGIPNEFPIPEGQLENYANKYREPVFPALKAGILTEIKYPTGGKTVFDFEPHTYRDSIANTGDPCKTIAKYASADVSYLSTNKTSTTTFYKSDIGDAIFSFEMANIKCTNYTNPSGPVVNCDSQNYTVNDQRFGQNLIKIFDPAGTKIVEVIWASDAQGNPKFYYFKRNDRDLGFMNSNVTLSQPIFSDGASVGINPQDGFVDDSSITLVDKTLKYLPIGTYTLEVTLDPDAPEGYIRGGVNYYEKVCNPPGGAPIVNGGGLRINHKTDYDHTGAELKKMSYDYSIGNLFNKPKYSIMKPGQLFLKGTLEGCYDVNYVYEKNSGTMFNNPSISGTLIGYDEVKISEVNFLDNSTNGYTINKYLNKPHSVKNVYTKHIAKLGTYGEYAPIGYNCGITIPSYASSYDCYPTMPNILINENLGALQKLTHYNNFGNKINETNYEYTILPIETILGLNVDEIPFDIITIPDSDPLDYRDGSVRNAILTWYKYYSVYNQLTKETTIDYDKNEVPALQTNTSYFYESNKHIKPTKTIVSKSSNAGIEETLINKTYYSWDVENSNSLPGETIANSPKPNLDALIRLGKATGNDHILVPVQNDIYLKKGNATETLLSRQRTLYDFYGALDLPSIIKTSKGNESLESRVVFQNYSTDGNILEVNKQEGQTISYVWGYGGQYPVAKVENATQAEITALNINTVLINNSSTTDAAMQDELKKIRDGLPNAMVTTYTYKPMVGITTVKDPRGQTTTYFYDDFNRLKTVKDAEGKVISDYQYHYKNQ